MEALGLFKGGWLPLRTVYLQPTRAPPHAPQAPPALHPTLCANGEVGGHLRKCGDP